MFISRFLTHTHHFCIFYFAPLQPILPRPLETLSENSNLVPLRSAPLCRIFFRVFRIISLLLSRPDRHNLPWRVWLISRTLSLTNLLSIFQIPATPTSQVLRHPLGLLSMLELCVLLCSLPRTFSVHSFLDDFNAADTWQYCLLPQFKLDSSH